MPAENALVGFHCPGCEQTYEPGAITVTCPNCDGTLDGQFEPTVFPATATALGEGSRSGLARFSPLLGLDLDHGETLGAGGTAPIECPSLAATAGVDRYAVLDEGRNPTGSATDRELAIAVSVAGERGADRILLASTGHAAQSAAAYAGRAGIDVLGFVPSRTPFLNKAMTNVHGGDLSVVEGGYADASAAFESADETGFPVDPRSPFRRLGAATIAWDVLGKIGELPDAIVAPVSHGLRMAGIHDGFRSARDAGLIDRMPRLYAAQPAGCAPIVDAYRTGASLESVDTPDTIVGPLEIPDPALGAAAIDAIAATDGGAVAVADDAALSAAVQANEAAGIECSATGGVAVAGTSALVDRGEISEAASVLVVDPLAAAGESDLLRSHLMSKGI